MSVLISALTFSQGESTFCHLVFILGWVLAKFEAVFCVYLTLLSFFMVGNVVCVAQY